MNYYSSIKNNIDFYSNNINESAINNFADILIKNIDKNIIILGIGKSQNAALQFCDLLRCINFKAVLLESSKILHGDIGFIREDDLVILLSNSGNTYELVEISKSIKSIKKNKLILLSSKKGKISDIVDNNFIIPVEQELEHCFGLIPTNSFLNFIIYFNQIISILIKKLKIDKNVYKENHICGNISYLFKNVIDKVVRPSDCSILKPSCTIKDLIISMNQSSMGVTIVKDENTEEVVGIITDRDLRLYLEHSDNLNFNIDKIMTKKFIYIDNNILINKIKYTHNYLPVIIDKVFYGIFINKSDLNI